MKVLISEDLLPTTLEEAIAELRWLLKRAVLDDGLEEDRALWNHYSQFGTGEAALQRIEADLRILRNLLLTRPRPLE